MIPLAPLIKLAGQVTSIGKYVYDEFLTVTRRISALENEVELLKLKIQRLEQK